MDKFLPSEQAPCGRLDAEGLKESFSNKHSCSRHRLAVPGELEIVGSGKGKVTTDRLKRAVPLLKILCSIRGIGSTGFSGTGLLLYNPYQLLRIVKRQRAQQNRIHHAKDHDICAYAECENQYGNDCEGGVALQGVDGKAQILHQDIKPGQSARFAMELTRLLHSAKLD